MNQRQTALISLLLGSFPAFQSGDAEAAIAAYQFVLKDTDERDLEQGVSILVNGLYPGHDGRFAPTAPQLATAVRMARDKRLDSDRRTAKRLPPPPDKVVTEEERARVKARFEALLANVVKEEKLEDEARVQRERERFARVNARFDPPQDDASIMERLMGYSVGSPESEREAS